MIPKKIHYCWLSKDEIPEKIQNYINSWKRLLPDYELIKWDLTKFPLEKNIWVRQAYENKKYAFAADYIRIYALYMEGGIYLDSDVEVVRSFDDLLNLPYFICKENSPQGLEAATIGSEKGVMWLKKCLEYYDGKSFIGEDGETNTKVLPAIIYKQINENFKIKYIDRVEEFDYSSDTVCVLSSDYFSPKNYVTKKILVTPNTYSIHHFAGSWQPLWKKLLLIIWVPFSIKYPRITNWIKKII